MGQKYTNNDFKRKDKKMSTLKKSILDLEDEIMVRTDNNRTNIVTQIKSLYRDLEQSFDKER